MKNEDEEGLEKKVWNENWIECEECGAPINTNKCYRDLGVWTWCPKCGLVVDDENHFDEMSTEEFSGWLRTHIPSLGYKDMRSVIELSKRVGNQKALKAAIDLRLSEDSIFSED